MSGRELCKSARADGHIRRGDAEFDNPVAIGVSAGGFHIDERGDEFWNVDRWVVCGLRAPADW